MPWHGVEITWQQTPLKCHSHVGLSCWRRETGSICILQYFQSITGLQHIFRSCICRGISNLSNACCKDLFFCRIYCADCYQIRFEKGTAWIHSFQIRMVNDSMFICPKPRFHPLNWSLSISNYIHLLFFLSLIGNY